MSLGDDERAVTVQVGTVLLFGALIVSLSVYQATAVPSQNEQVEFKHNQRVQGDMVEARNAIVRAANAGQDGAVAVELGTTYPTRIIAVNPAPPSGTLRTTEPRNITVESGGDSARDVCPGADETRSLLYSPSYNEHRNAPTTIYENTVLYNRFEGANVTKTRQRLVYGNESVLDLVALRGTVSESSSRTVSVDVVQGETDTTTVTDPTVALPTRLSQEQWTELLENEVNESDLTVDGGELTLELSGEYTVRCTAVGLNRAPPSGAADPDDGGDGDGNKVNPAGEVMLKGATADQHDATILFENRGNDTQNITEARLSFYQSEKKSKQTPSTGRFVDPDRSDTPLHVGGNFKPIEPSISLPGNQSTSITMRFDERISKGDFFVLKVVFEDGDSATYFIAPST